MSNNLTLDLDSFERIMIYNSIMDHSYLESIFEHIKPSFFKNENIRKVFELIISFYKEFNSVPNITELKTHIRNNQDKTALKEVILSFESIDKKYNKDALVKNTERFLKEKSVMETYRKTSVDIQSGDIDSFKILKDFEKSCSISLLDNLGFDYLESIDQHCTDLQKVFKTISTGWKWLDSKIGGGFMAEGRSL